MERRKFIIGAGALATGSAAAMGTGALSSFTAGRDANIDVVNDDEALIGLESKVDSDVVAVENGNLAIDFETEEGSEGVAPNSEYKFGSVEPWDGDEAIRIKNQDSEGRDITVTFEWDEDPGTSRGTYGFRFFLDTPEEQTGTAENYAIVRTDDDSGSRTVTVEDGSYAGLSFVLEVGELTVDDIENADWSGTLTIEAE